MEASFWHERWANNQIGFHQAAPNPHLVNEFQQLGLAVRGRVLVPLCGKTLDIGWLLEQGYAVAGAELSALAITQLFEQLGLTPTITAHGALQRYSAPNLDIFVGDIFELTAELLGPVDAIYDRAAMVALPETMRPHYAAHLRALTGTAPQLLITYEYDQQLMKGPPFSVPAQEVRDTYGAAYRLTQASTSLVDGSPLGRPDAQEYVWLLR